GAIRMFPYVYKEQDGKQHYPHQSMSKNRFVVKHNCKYSARLPISMALIDKRRPYIGQSLILTDKRPNPVGLENPTVGLKLFHSNSAISFFVVCMRNRCDSLTQKYNER